VNIINIIIWLLASTLISCYPDNKQGSTEATNSTHPIKTQEEDENKLPVVRVMITSDDSPNKFMFSDHYTMKYFREKYGNYKKNHIIIKPQYTAQFDSDFKDAIVHPSNVKNIQENILNIAKKYAPERMVIYLAAHGARNGSLCYDNSNICSFTNQHMLEIINSLDELNKNRLSDRLKQLLIIPLSCYHQAFAVKLFDSLNKNAYKSFAVIMPHLRALTTEKCGLHMSVNHFLFMQQIYFAEYQKFAFKNWASKDNRVSRLLNITTLEDFISIANEVLQNNVIKAEKRETEITSFAKNHEDAVVNLEAFELSPIFLYDNHPNNNDIPGLPIIGGEFTASARAIAHHLIDNSQLEAAILKIASGNNSYDKNSSAYDTQRSWKTDERFRIYIETMRP
jgi:hypothetical protein